MPKRDNFSTLTHIEQDVRRTELWMQGVSQEDFLMMSSGKPQSQCSEGKTPECPG